jgi:hypothetical protein
MDMKNQPIDTAISGKPNKRSAGWDLKVVDVPCRKQPEFSAEALLIVQNGVIKQSNPVMAEMSAYAIEEVLDTCIASFFDAEHIAAVEFLCEHFHQGLEAPEKLEATLVCKNGRRALTRITAVPCTFNQKPACLLKIRHMGFITMLLEASAQEGANFPAGTV